MSCGKTISPSKKLSSPYYLSQKNKQQEEKQQLQHSGKDSFAILIFLKGREDFINVSENLQILRLCLNHQPPLYVQSRQARIRRATARAEIAVLP